MHPPRSYLRYIGFEGALITAASSPLILACMSVGSTPPPLWRITTAVGAAISCLIAAFLLFRRPMVGIFFGGIALAASVATAFPYLSSTPFAALLGSVTIISVGFALKDFKVRMKQDRCSTHRDRCLKRARWSSLTVPLLVVVALVVNPRGHILASGAIVAAAMANQFLILHWVWNRKIRSQVLFWSALCFLALAAIIFSFFSGYVRTTTISLSILIFLLLPGSALGSRGIEHWWEPLLSHPARILFSTFLGLCILGALLLQLPGASGRHTISFINATFTSVSAVCVTGLIVLDTPHDFSLFGQTLILLLIQFGGLGIMTITTVALHAMGRRLSLRHERVLTTITATDRHELVASLITILRFTFAAEGVGALILFWLFFKVGDPVWTALWRGMFTSVSAFCNAGFALQSDSLISYQKNPLILHTVSTLIIFGGMAPATSLIVPKWIRKRPIPIAANIVLITTTILLFSGTFLVLALEWNGVLAGLTIVDKIHNAWFQSATLRTAGFNSVEINGITNPTFLIMIFFMFVGGSPGGTAGGIKTTTLGILAMTFWANVRGRAEVVAQNRQIPSETIHRAVTVIGSGTLAWFTIVLMLEITQQIPARDIIFEVTSALGTVGLSTGTTGLLDGIGKIIIIIAMFVGRIGPITMFMLLNEEHSVTHSRCPDAQITLT